MHSLRDIRGFSVIDEYGKLHSFTVAYTEGGGRGIVISSKPWEPGDPSHTWRRALHPFHGGLYSDRLKNQNVYVGANADASYEHLLLFPPKLNSITLANGVSPVKGINFEDKLYFVDGRYMYYYDPATDTATQDKDFGAGKAAVDGCVFNNELIVAMGEQEKIWKRTKTLTGTANAAVTTTDTTLVDTRLNMETDAWVDGVITCNGKTMTVTSNSATTFTGASWSGGANPGNGNSYSIPGFWKQAGDAVYALALGVSGSRLNRGFEQNRIASCSETPLTLSQWDDSSGYTVGDTTWPIVSIVDYGGVAWIGRGDGMFAPDAQTRFFNQTPQLGQYPHADNCKGAFTAKGALFIPSASGLIMVTPGGISKVVGPEKSNRPSFRFWVRGGVEWGGDIYLLVTDQAASANTFICKMSKDAFDLVPSNDWIYHEWVRAGATTKGYFISLIAATQPRLVFGLGANLRWIKLGRGGGRDVDDSNYEFGTAMELETGPFTPSGDISIVSTLVGVTVLLDYSTAGETLTAQYSVDGGTYYDMLSSQEGGGTAPIQKTDGWESVRRYAGKDAQGQYFSIKLTGGLTSASGTSRPEIREVWAHGYSHPKATDVISIAVAAETGITNDGALAQHSASEIHDQFKKWHDSGVILELKLNNYEENKPIRVIVTSVKALDATTTLGPGEAPRTQYQIQVELVRVDYSSGYGR